MKRISFILSTLTILALTFSMQSCIDGQNKKGYHDKTVIRYR